MTWFEALSWWFLGFAGLEIASIFMHKYLFHGPLWFLHKSHHAPRKGFWENNDVFSLFFAGVSIVLFLTSRSAPLEDYRFWLASGMTTFGLGYFVVHDIWAHKRAFRRSRAPWSWIDGLVHAHRHHHRMTTKDGTGPYGLFLPGLEKRLGIWN
jgi:beta-carotene 3-hydroxylase